MKKLRHILLGLLTAIFFFRRNRQVKNCEKALTKALKDKEHDQIILKAEIMHYMRGYLKVNARSKFIPKEYKNDAEIIQQVLGKFGTQMTQLDIRINNRLELCTL